MTLYVVPNVENNTIMRKKITLAILCWLSSVLAVYSAFAGPSIIGVRVGDYPGYTRLVFDLDGQVDHKVSIRLNPPRLIVDLPRAVWKPRPQKLPSGRLIKGYRFGHLDNSTSRIVVDLGRPCALRRTFQIMPKAGRPHRLIVEIDTAAKQSALENQGGVIRQRRDKRLASKNNRDSLENRKLYENKRKKPLIIIDPGHGGVDPGARGRSGIWEKNIVLKQALILREKIISTGRYRVLLTRTKDVFLSLKKRIQIAHSLKADLFLSIHADSIERETVRGASVYTLSEKASDRQASILADRENKSDIIAGIDLSDTSKSVARILIDLSQRLTKNESISFAEMLVEEFRGRIPLLRKNRRFAGFVVLKAAGVPSVLIEMGYLSNREDERLLRSPRYQKEFAGAVLQAIERYFALRKEQYSP